MEERQVEQLKLNVTNIKNSLFSSNKEIKKLKTDKRNLFSKLEKKKDFREEEQRLEGGKLGVASGFSRIMSSVTSPVRSIFDRILDFIGLIAAGILINNLPAIIQKVQEFFDSDFIKGIGNLLGIIGNGILKLAEFAGLFPKSEQDNIEKNIKETEKRFDDDIKNADAAEKDIISLERFLGSSSYQESTGSDSAEPKTPEPKTPTPKESFSSGSDSNTKEITASKPAQSFSRGGTVRSEGSSSQTSSLESKQTYKPQMSGVPKKVERDTNNGFRNFPIAVDNIYETTRQHEKNVLAFSKMLKKSRDVGISTSPSNPSNPSDSSDPSNSPSPSTPNIPITTSGIITDEIVGYVGSTGRSSGPHIHIETGDGYSGSGGNIPDNVLSNIIVDGTSLSSYEMGDGLYAGRNHRGFDYPIRSGAPITLKGGLKFLEYDSGDNAGYGNSLIIVGTDGRKYLIGHLDSGPPNPEKIRESNKNNNKPEGPILTPFQKKYFKGYGEGGSNYRLNRSMNNQSVFIYAVQPVENYVPFPYPMPIETPVPVPTSSPQLPSIWRT
jgi:hypothetical protein